MSPRQTAAEAISSAKRFPLGHSPTAAGPPYRAGARGVGDVRLSVGAFGEGATLEGPARFMRTRFVTALREESPPPVSPEDQRAYLETAPFKQELAPRVGLPTSPQYELYDVVVLGAGLARDGDNCSQ